MEVCEGWKIRGRIEREWRETSEAKLGSGHENSRPNERVSVARQMKAETDVSVTLVCSVGRKKQRQAPEGVWGKRRTELPRGTSNRLHLKSMFCSGVAPRNYRGGWSPVFNSHKQKVLWRSTGVGKRSQGTSKRVAGSEECGQRASAGANGQRKNRGDSLFLRFHLLPLRVAPLAQVRDVVKRGWDGLVGPDSSEIHVRPSS